ncbi:MAG: hypothetical protein H7259_04200 [Cytophagales bacterium]|nr:hypothetical protein [Cytophaga sp.]
MFLKNTYYFVIVLVTLAITTSSCKKAPNYSKIPAIEFESLTVISEFNTLTDSVYLKISFTDGDGNIGNAPAGPNDFFAVLQKKIEGKYVDVNTNGLSFNGNLPLLSPYSLSGPIDGTITNNILFLYSTHPAIDVVKGDTVRFNVRIQDRAQNYSNWVTTTEMIMWKNF